MRLPMKATSEKIQKGAAAYFGRTSAIGDLLRRHQTDQNADIGAQT